MANDTALDAEGWCLIAPFGEHAKSRLVRTASGTEEQRFIQVLDNESADSVLSSENSIFRRIKRAFVGMTAFKGHPDLKKHAPETLDNSGGTQPIRLGLVDKLRKTDRGLEAHFVIDPDMAEAVENEGYKYPSVLWMVQPTGENRHGAAVVKPYQLLSIGLTPHPNIPGVDSLANANASQSATTPAISTHDMQLRENLTGLLIGKGINPARLGSDADLIRILANADMDDDGDADAAAIASAQAHRKSARANDPASDAGAAQAHLKAMAAQQAAGNDKKAALHKTLADHHLDCAATGGETK